MHSTKANILGCNVDIINAGQALDSIEAYVEEGRPSHVITLNAEIVYEAQANADLKNIINRADLVTPDGIGIVWGGKHLGYPFEERVTGIDLLMQICQRAVQKKWKLYFFGAAPGVAEAAAEKLREEYTGLEICGTRNGYFKPEDNDTIVREIKEQDPHILFVALGAPKQEVWIQQYMDVLNVPVCIGVGGSFDVIAGNKKRAPQWMITLNLEWLYRLLAEPNRFRRQLVLPKFVLCILREKRSKAHQPGA